MEAPTIPLESAVELFTNGSLCACCIKSGIRVHPDGGPHPDTPQRCSLRDSCHTKRVKEMLTRMLDRRAFLPKDSGMLMR
jgi:hypothetical protein